MTDARMKGKMENLELLKDTSLCYTDEVKDLLSRIELMKNKEILQQHPYSISQGSDGRYRTYVADATKASGRRQIAKNSLELLEKAIISDHKNCREKNDINNLNLENLYQRWMIWRRDIGTDPKTIELNACDWNRFIKQSDLPMRKIRDISLFDLEDFFLKITANHAVTFKHLSNLRTVLSGIYKYAIRLGIIEHSIVFDVDYSQFRNRCKPQTSNKKIFSDKERKAILVYLEEKNDVFSLAILFAFRLCLRIGELQVIKQNDIQGDILRIERSMRKRRIMNDDLTFAKVEYDIDSRIKGNAEEGIRNVTLTPQAQEIAKKVAELYPGGEYLFEHNGKPILGITFNRHLKRACEALDIAYRSSHKIRFTTATNLLEAGVPLNQVSNELGHADVRTTFIYIRKRVLDERSKEIIRSVQDI